MSTEVSTFRLYFMRATYALVAVGLGMQMWPAILDPTKSWQLMQGVVVCMLGAMSLMAVLGIRYPLQMLPILLFELTWKSIWLLKVALPLWNAGNIDEDTAETVKACLMGVIFLIAIPWRYTYENFVKKAGDPWGRHAEPRATA